MTGSTMLHTSAEKQFGLLFGKVYYPFPKPALLPALLRVADAVVVVILQCRFPSLWCLYFFVAPPPSSALYIANL